MSAFYYELEQSYVVNQGSSFITNWGRYDCRLKQVYQIRAGITNWGKLLQIRA